MSETTTRKRDEDRDGEPPRKTWKLNDSEHKKEEVSTSGNGSTSTVTDNAVAPTIKPDSEVGQEASIQGRPSSQNDSEPLHPLLHIEHILENVLNRLDLESLKSSNLVCKTWSKKVRSLMIKNKIIRISQTSAEEILNEDGSNDLAFIKDDIFGHSVNLKLNLKDSAELPLTEEESNKFIDFPSAERLILYLSDNKQTTIENLIMEIGEDDISKLSSLIKNTSYCLHGMELQFRLDEDPSEFSFPVTNLWLRGPRPAAHLAAAAQDEPLDPNLSWLEDEDDTTSFPKLKSLVGDFSDQFDYNILKILKKLFVSSPNLSEIDCKMASNHHEMFDALKDHPDILQNLKSLSNVSINQEEMEILRRKNLRLEKLSFRLYSGFRVREMSTWLSSLSKTLKILKIDFVNLPNQPELFPCGKDLVNLTDLTLEKFYGSIHFISEMPNLRSLVLINVNLSVALHDDANKYNYKSKLKRLEIFGGQGSNGRFLLPAIYNHIVRFFPALKVLRMEYLMNTSLKILIQGLKQLEELYLPNGVYSDEILIAYSSSSADVISLADLKNLRKLLLQSIKITDVGIQHGLIRYRELRSLSIDSPVISDTSLRSLCDLENLQDLEFLNCYRLSPQAINEVKEKLGKRKRLVVTQA